MSGYEWEDPDPVFEIRDCHLPTQHVVVLSPEQYAGCVVLTRGEAPICPHREQDRDVVCPRPAGHEGKCWRMSGVLALQVAPIAPVR